MDTGTAYTSFSTSNTVCKGPRCAVSAKVTCFLSGRVRSAISSLVLVRRIDLLKPAELVFESVAVKSGVIIMVGQSRGSMWGIKRQGAADSG